MQFQYEAIDRKGGRTKGVVDAANTEQAVERLKQNGLYCLHIKPVKPSIWRQDLNVLLGRPVKMREFVVFCRLMATMLRTGTTVADAVGLLVEQMTSKTFKNVLASVQQTVAAGRPLSEACEAHPRHFPSLFVQMVRAGELSGELDDVMDHLARYYEWEHQLREKVKSALMYPALVSVVSVFVIIFMLVYTIPKLVGTLVQAGSALPLPTAIVLGVSEFLTRQWPWLVALLIGVFITVWRLRQSPQWRYRMDRVKLSVPIFGSLVSKSAMARLARTLGSLLASAVPMLQALDIAGQIVGNEVLSGAIKEAKKTVSQGGQLSAALAETGAFPPMVIHMMKVGEQSGQLDDMLQKLARFYESDVDHLSSRLSAALEPILIAVLAVVVGFILLAALLPVFEIYSNV